MTKDILHRLRLIFLDRILAHELIKEKLQEIERIFKIDTL